MSHDTEKQALAIAIRDERVTLRHALDDLATSTRARAAQVKERFDVMAHVRATPGRFILAAFAAAFFLAFATRRST